MKSEPIPASSKNVKGKLDRPSISECRGWLAIMRYVYILESLVNGKYYIGSTNNLEKWLIKHNTRQVFSTKSNAPFKIVFNKKYENSVEARQSELKLKRLKRKDYIQKIIKGGEVTLRAISSSGRAIDS